MIEVNTTDFYELSWWFNETVMIYNKASILSLLHSASLYNPMVLRRSPDSLRLHSLSSCSRREDKLRIPNGWLCHLAPEIIQQLSPDTEEDKLPFSKQSDVFAFGWASSHLLPPVLTMHS